MVVRWATGERTFTGNTLELIDRVRDALAELNEPYRLKGPRSVDVRAFEPLALKELLVNALVHRDYDVARPVRITLTDADVSFVSPGGVISTVDPERLGRAGVRGYRNQVIANVLFGTGDMDKLGSGLLDVRRWAQEAGSDATFSVPADNDEFVARLGAARSGHWSRSAGRACRIVRGLLRQRPAGATCAWVCRCRTVPGQSSEWTSGIVIPGCQRRPSSYEADR